MIIFDPEDLVLFKGIYIVDIFINDNRDRDIAEFSEKNINLFRLNIAIVGLSYHFINPVKTLL